MKFKLLLLFVILSGFSADAQKTPKPKMQIDFWDFEKKHMKSRGFYYADLFYGETTLKHGKWEYWDREGRLLDVQNYLKGELHGKVTSYYPNGKKKEEGFFDNGKQDSVYTSWWENGNVKALGYYNKDRAAGTWMYYYKNGYHMMEEENVDSITYVRNFWRTDSSQTVKDGNGRTLIYYEATGYLQEFYTYKDGLKDGDFEEYTPTGKIFVIGQYKEGDKIGDWTYYYYLGGVDRKISYLSDKPHGPYKKYYDNGKLNVEGTFDQGNKTGKWTWYTNVGTKDMEGNFVDGKQDGLWKYWIPGDSLAIGSKGYFKEDYDMVNGNSSIRMVLSGKRVNTNRI
jgi:antitoxin component YwqK of YwqJK toxin-antitoxin module